MAPWLSLPRAAERVGGPWSHKWEQMHLLSLGAKLIEGKYRKGGNCFATSAFPHSWRSMAWSGWLSVVLGGDGDLSSAWII